MEALKGFRATLTSMEQIVYSKMPVMCKSKAEMNYYETKEQFFRDVLFDPKSYNNMINCRIGGKQIKNLKK